jgi:hypothetical protein
MPPQIDPLDRCQRFSPSRPGERVVGIHKRQCRAETLAEPHPLIEQQGSPHPAGQPEKPENQHNTGRNAPEYPKSGRRYDNHRQETLHQYREGRDDTSHSQNPTSLLEKQIHATADLDRPDFPAKCSR